jgi:crotonobetainyl-CoA:carnitine CoA-transferase CaiB-like acyl-CoA transferase
MEVVDLLSKAGVVVSEVNDIPGVRELPMIEPKLCTVEFPPGHTVHLPPTAFMGEDAIRSFSPPPRYGQHTRTVLTEAGCTAGEIDSYLRTCVAAAMPSEG